MIATFAQSSTDGEHAVGITIDGPTSKDLDDALWVECTGDRIRFRVFIADVAGAVRKDSEWDLAARRKGYTRYGAARNWPMLPPALADDRLSLLPHQNRDAVCIEFELDPSLNPCDIRISGTPFKSLARFTYQEAAELVMSPSQPTAISARGKPHSSLEISTVLTMLSHTATGLLKKRRDRGDLAVYDVLKGWQVSESGELQRIPAAHSNVGYIIVQEFMVLANKLVAEFLVRSNMPALYRNHRALLTAQSRDSMSHDIEAAFTRPDLVNISTLQQRIALTMQRAEYSPLVGGHYALNLPVYCHATSPLRRYPDLVNQRILKALLRATASPYGQEELEAIASDINQLKIEDDRRSDAFFKQKAARIGEQRLSLSAAQLASVPTKEFYAVIKAALNSDELPENLQEAVRLRQQAKVLSIKEQYYLLFESLALSDSWLPMRLDILEGLVSRACDGVALLDIGVNLRGWKTTEYRFSQTKAGFTCSASIEHDGVRFVTDPVWASAKVTCQQLSAVALCFLLCNEEPPSARPAPPPVTVNPRPTEMAQIKADELDFISAIFLLATKSNWPRPRFSVNQHGDHHSLRFEVVCTVRSLSKSWVGIGEAATKKGAFHAAARGVWEQLQEGEHKPVEGTHV